MIVRINGRPLDIEVHATANRALSPSVIKNTPPLKPKGDSFFLNPWRRTLTSGLMSGAAVTVSGGSIVDRFWPIISQMQEFGLIVGIGFGLWGVYMIMIGNPEGKQKLIQALIGFIGLYIVPEGFMAIRDALRR